ncbi:EMILIN-3 isoform X2 [Canis lupus baileyi]|uniref:Elastin microfibril interfacer 3 n=3 Tax=Canis lupus familiaris TaxID=9615 RepID=A0A8C0RED1_CANLF|nr:EMILIN-3 isoform X2 [Canis lupus dingo]XP_038289775.1 EMILIN-3 isoform X2 [Canis lupus familiaris]XP_038428259.1 EMILIN-3 isoform X2 [Canis lupus familiaris]XP_543001.2 EMILIN-3 isoform X2 [Canis lupus familiaris]|eukprot:XP_543001.2 EMILIN-3 isoform X1 [Canis lupus familiaris]
MGRRLPVWLCAVAALLSGAQAKGTPLLARPAPPGAPRYSLYTTGWRPRLRPGPHKALCAYVVHRNVTCVLQEGADSYVKAEYRQCGWGPKCPGTIMYRTVLRPRYKVGYKTVTDLAWRCCPGLTGEGCPEHLTDHGATPAQPEPEPQIPSGQLGPGPQAPSSSRAAPSPYGRKGPGLFGERLERLEGDVQRLAQAYGTLSGLVASHEDPNKMTGGPRAPVAPVGFGVISEGFVRPRDRAGGPLPPPLDEILSKVTEVSNTLRTKVQLLDEVHGLALGHEAHLQRLREAPPSPLTSLALLDEYVDRRLQRLWGSLLDGFEQRLQGVQSTCDLRVQEVRQQCEEGQAASQRLHQSLDGRELALRRELSQLGTRLQGLSVAGGSSCCSRLALISARVDNLERNLRAVAEARRGHGPLATDELERLSAAMLEGGVDGLLEGLETLNGTERGVRGCCLGMEEGGWEAGGFRTTLEERVRSLEERLAALAGELSHHGGGAPPPPGRPARPLVQTELAVLEQRLVSLETSCAPSTTSAILDNLAAEVKAWQSRSEALLRQVAGHAALLRQLNGTVAEVQEQLAEATGSSLQGEITLLKVNLNSVSKSLTGLSDSVSQYSDAFLAANSSLDERERKVEAEVHAIQEQVSSQGSRLQAGHRQVLSLRGELERLKAGMADVAGGLSRCQDTAQELRHVVGHFDQRVAQVEGACGRLGLLAAGLDRLPTESLRPREGLWGYVDQLNRTLAQHAQDIARLRDDLLDCRAQLAEQVRPRQAD